MSFFEELKRRNVFRVAIGYVITAWLLLQVVDLVLENINAPDWVMQVFMLALAIGFPLAVFFAWAFEMTPEGVKREADVDRSQPASTTTGRTLDRSIIIVLALALAYFAYDKFSGASDGEPSQTGAQVREVEEATDEKPLKPVINNDEKSIAVLPLVNRSVNAEDAFFAEGLHDELLTQLSKVSALRVISRTSVMGYAGTTKRIPEIAGELGVKTLLEGGVQRSGDRVRINVQLIDASTDEHLWAEVYDRELTANNLFDIQSNITQAIAKALQAVLTGAEEQTLEQKPTQNLDAYAYYLRGKAESKGYGREKYQIKKTITSFQAAIKLDPQFAAAYAALAIDWAELYWGTDKLGNELELAHEALLEAQELAPQAAETLIAEGYYHYWGHLDYARGIAAFDRALEIEPANYQALRGKAYALRRLGKLEASILLFKKALLTDPLDPELPADLAYSLLRLGQLEEAEVMVNRSILLAASIPWNRFVHSEQLLMKGELEGAAKTMGVAMQQAGVSSSYVLDVQLLIARALGNNAIIDQMLEKYQDNAIQTLGPQLSRAIVYIDRDEQDKLNDLLTKMQTDVQTAMAEQPKAAINLMKLIAYQGLRRDKVKLAEAIENYYANTKPDALEPVFNRTIPVSYAIAGDTDALLDYIENTFEQFGPWEFYYYAIDPIFDNMRDLPRFQALDKRYRQWLEQVE